jgi:polyhydroxyalkanoate synthesis regulator phasin
LQDAATGAIIVAQPAPENPMAEPPPKSRAATPKPKKEVAEAPLDPVAVWQKFVSDWEKQINEVSAKVTATEEFSRALNQATKYSVVAQQQFDRQMEQFLRTLHLPSKSDITDITERLARIEESLERLALTLTRDQRPAATALPRTRQPPEGAG